MYGLTRATLTLIGAAGAGVLLWLSTRIVGDAIDTNGDYWVTVLLIAAAGLTLVLSQLLGGWTKWGWPRFSGNVFLFAFLPVLVVVGWVLIASQPDPNWLRDHVSSWSHDIGIGGLVSDFTRVWQALAVVLGLVSGLTLDTTGPRLEPLFRRGAPGPHPLANRPAEAPPATQPAEAAPADTPRAPGASSE
jgi:hypothetical protein